MSKLALVLVLSSSMLLPQLSLAKKGGGMRAILKQLDLTDDQREKLKAARKENKKMGKVDKEQIKKTWEEMRNKFASDASESELRSLHDKLKELKSEKREKRFNRLMKIRNILTIEQRKKFQELRHAKRKGRKHGFDEE